jgi:hypothetical protein
LIESKPERLVRRERGKATRILAFQMELIQIIAGMMGAACSSAIRGCACRSARAAQVGSPMRCTAWIEFEDRFRDLMNPRPSEYWRRQCKATFQFDPIGTKLVDDIGVETLIWGSDYPHTDGVWPESSNYIEEQFAGLAPEIVHKITCENAGKFYGLIN